MDLHKTLIQMLFGTTLILIFGGMFAMLFTL